MRKLPRVLIVEDEPAIAELISVNLRHNGFQPFWAEDGEAAQRELDAVLPDVILLDWMLPGQSGLQLARKWRANSRTKQVPILMLTARGDEPDKVAGLDAGADDYITKPFSPREFVARVRAVLRRSGHVEQGVITIGDTLVIDPGRFEVRSGSDLVALTQAEFRILLLLASNRGRVFTRERILDHLWGTEKAVLDRTVDVHIKNLRDKLGGCGKLITNIRGVGYKMEA